MNCSLNGNLLNNKAISIINIIISQQNKILRSKFRWEFHNEGDVDNLEILKTLLKL